MRWLFLLVGCVNAGGTAGVPEGDSLAVDAPVAPGSLDELHRTIIQPTCASQPGACHAGQFEPNMSTPALFYANLVLRPGREHDKVLRVNPGDPDHSLVIDKLRKRNQVATRMPLGAQPLPEDQIQLFERWIAGGALRKPGDSPAPVLNNPPSPPEIAVFDQSGKRLDQNGRFTVNAGDSIVLRHDVKDFETPDDQMAYAGFIAYLPDNSTLMLSKDPQSYGFASAEYDPNAPDGTRRPLSYRFAWTVPSEIDVADPAGTILPRATSGMSLTLVAYYADRADADAISTYTVVTDLMVVK